MDVNGSNMIKLFIKLLNIHIHTYIHTYIYIRIYIYTRYMYTKFIYIYIQVNFQFRIPSKIRPEAFLKGTLCTWLSGRERGVKPWVVTGPPPIGLLKVKACGVREFHDFRRDLTPKNIGHFLSGNSSSKPARVEAFIGGENLRAFFWGDVIWIWLMGCAASCSYLGVSDNEGFLHRFCFVMLSCKHKVLNWPNFWTNDYIYGIFWEASSFWGTSKFHS